MCSRDADLLKSFNATNNTSLGNMCILLDPDHDADSFHLCYFVPITQNHLTA